METLLRDVHHYLFNVEFSPRPGASFRVQDEIRRRFLDAVIEGSEKPGPHIVVSHSMGTVIAYDCLKRVPECPEVDGLMTIGSPLGLDEIQDKLQPGWSRNDGFPHERVRGGWINVYDRFDPVAGIDPERSATTTGGAARRSVRDINEQNSGKWRHNIGKYFAARGCAGRPAGAPRAADGRGVRPWPGTARNSSRLKAAVDAFDKAEAARLCDELIAYLDRSDDIYEEKTAKTVLGILRRKCYFDLLQRVADASCAPSKPPFRSAASTRSR